MKAGNSNDWADVLIGRPRIVAGITLCLVAASFLVLLRTGVAFDHDIEGFFPEVDPTIETFRRFVEQYEPDDASIFLGIPQEDVFDVRFLRELDDLTRQLEDVDGVTGVQSISTYRRFSASGAAVSVGCRPDGASGIVQAERCRMAIAEDRLLGEVLSNGSQTVTGVVVNIDPGLNTYQFRSDILGSVRSILGQFSWEKDVRVSGIPFLRNYYVDALNKETFKYLAISSLALILVLFLLFRSILGVVLPLLVVYVGAIWTITAMMLFGSAIDVLTSTVSAILLVVGVADSVYFLNRYLEGTVEGGRRAAVRAMLVDIGPATLFTSLTTAIGFATLATSSIVPVQRFGLFTALGVMLTFLATVGLLTPVLLRVGPEASPRKPDAQESGLLVRLLDLIHSAVFSHPKAVVFCGLVIAAGFASGIVHLKANSFVNDDLGPTTSAVRDMEFIQDNLVSPFRYELLVRPVEGSLFQAQRVRDLSRLGSELEKHPAVTNVVSLGAVMESVHAELSKGESVEYTQAQFDGYLAIMNLYGQEALARLVDPESNEARVSIAIKDIGSYAMRDFEGYVDELVEEYAWIGATPRTGTVVLAGEIGSSMTSSLLLSIGLACLFISVLMGIIFRSVSLAVLALIPNTLPLLMTAGLMGWLGIDIKPATAVVFSMAFGIAVDDTIHAMARIRKEVAGGLSLESATAVMIRRTGKPMIVTSIVLLCGFGVLVTSIFESSSQMGFLVAVTIAFALFADLLILPALIVLFRPKTPAPRR